MIIYVIIVILYILLYVYKYCVVRACVNVHAVHAWLGQLTSDAFSALLRVSVLSQTETLQTGEILSSMVTIRSQQIASLVVLYHY